MFSTFAPYFFCSNLWEAFHLSFIRRGARVQDRLSKEVRLLFLVLVWGAGRRGGGSYIRNYGKAWGAWIQWKGYGIFHSL